MPVLENIQQRYVPIPSGFDAWRNSVDKVGRKHIKVSLSRVPGEPRATCLTECQKRPLIAVGNSSGENNLVIVEHITKEEQPEFKILSGFTTPSPIYTISWIDNTLLSGGNHGLTNLFTLEEENDELKMTCKLQYKHRISKTASPVGNFVSTSRVRKVEFNDDNKFMDVIGPLVYFWDIENTSTPIRSDKVARDTIFDASWAPPSLHSAPLLAVGSADKSVSVLDMRKDGKPMVWKAQKGHDSVINEVQWNPFVPYWIASGGDDHMVKLWDIRFNSGPVSIIDAHFNHLAWSGSHADILATGSSDRNWRLWGIRESKEIDRNDDTGEKIGEYGRGFSGPVISVISSLHHENTFYSLSMMGELALHSIQEELFSLATPHRVNPQEHPIEHEVEKNVYMRDLENAQKLVLEVVNKTEGDSRNNEEIRRLIKILSPTPTIEPSSWSIASSVEGSYAPDFDPISQPIEREAVEAFQKDLRIFSSRVPAHLYSNISLLDENGELKRLYSLIDIVEFVKQGDWKALLDNEEVIITAMKNGSICLNSKDLEEIIKVILPNDCLKALEMGLRFACTYHALENRQLLDLVSLTHTLLYPTIFDPDTGEEGKTFYIDGAKKLDIQQSTRTSENGTRLPTPENAIRKLMKEPQLILDMLNLEVKIQKMVVQGGEKLSDRLVHTMRGQRTISAGATKLYLDALMQLQRFDEYMMNSLDLISIYSNFDFSRELKKQCLEVAYPRLNQYLDEVIEILQNGDESSTGISKSEVRLSRDTLLMLVNLIEHCQPGRLDLTETNWVEKFNVIQSIFFQALALLTEQLGVHAAQKETKLLRRIIVETLKKTREPSETTQDFLKELKKYS
ncbi:hypothetical protein K7432_002173 [Basidiobolus ranarum]|uniref:Uncharacterized protein n=1 Tax=Basidiobolus ranarum TaxID=34480 RepID=A0ABR2W8Q3_9FUNG